MTQGTLFDFPQYQINKKIRLIELFGGLGSQAMALRDLGADFENYRLVEIDKHAVKVYNAIHNTSFTPADIKDIKGVDLGTEREREVLLPSHLFFPLYRFVNCGQDGRNVKSRLGKRQQYKKRAIVGSRTHIK